MANDAPCAAKAAYHLFGRNVFISIHSDEIDDVLLTPLAIWATQAQASRLLLDRPLAPPEMPFEVRERDTLIRIHLPEVGDFLVGPANLGHAPPLLVKMRLMFTL